MNFVGGGVVNNGYIYGDRTFSVYAPQVCNALPVSLRMINVFNTFKVSLKTYLFRKFFS